MYDFSFNTIEDYFKYNIILYELMLADGKFIRVPFETEGYIFDGYGIVLPHKSDGRNFFTINDIGVTLFKSFEGND